MLLSYDAASSGRAAPEAPVSFTHAAMAAEAVAALLAHAADAKVTVNVSPDAALAHWAATYLATVSAHAQLGAPALTAPGSAPGHQLRDFSRHLTWQRQEQGL
jgi:hypothetical protein